MDKRGPIRSIVRSIAVLKAINRAGALSLVDIAKASGVPHQTAFRIAQTLVLEGLIEREPGSKRYRPTAMVQSLSHGYDGYGELLTLARPHIVALTQQVLWPVTLATRVGQAMVVRDSTHAISPLTLNYYPPGYTLPILECASGQAYLAFTTPEERAAIIQRLHDLPEIDTPTLALFENGLLVDAIRREGFTVKRRNRHTANPGKTSSLAMPVFRDGELVATVAMAFFATALPISEAVERFLPLLRRTARDISDALGNSSQDRWAA